MRTYSFRDYRDMKHGKFIPMQTIVSEEFGRHFFIDIGFNFISAPSYSQEHMDFLKDDKIGYDESQLDYVSNWTELEGVDMVKLFDIYRDLTWQENNDSNEKSSEQFANYIDDVENGRIEYL